MENYEKSNVILEENEPLYVTSLTSNKIDSNAIHMEVKCGSKMKNLTNFAFKQFDVI
jgi:hypothetical protein